PRRARRGPLPEAARPRGFAHFENPDGLETWTPASRVAQRQADPRVGWRAGARVVVGAAPPRSPDARPPSSNEKVAEGASQKRHADVTKSGEVVSAVAVRPEGHRITTLARKLFKTRPR